MRSKALRKGWRQPVSVNRRRRREQKELSSSWLQTYSDLMSLLFALFVLLFAFSNIDRDRFTAIISSFQGSIGVIDGGQTITRNESISGADSLRAELIRRNPLEIPETHEIISRLTQFREQEGIEGAFTVDIAERGIVLHFTEGVLFDLGSAELKQDSQRVLRHIFDIVRSWPYHIRVEGHTDNWPIDTVRFPSNWELSTARAARVVRFAVDDRKFSPDRLSAAGYGEYRPIASNETADGRSRNRRVDIVLLSGVQTQSEPTTSLGR